MAPTDLSPYYDAQNKLYKVVPRDKVTIKTYQFCLKVKIKSTGPNNTWWSCTT